MESQTLSSQQVRELRKRQIQVALEQQLLFAAQQAAKAIRRDF